MSEGQAQDQLALHALRAAEMAAIAAHGQIGRGDKNAADQAAVDAMRKGLNAMAMKGRIVIGEGERDEAPMLYIGEEVGTGEGPEIDIALDPIEGTTPTSKGMPNALAVLAIAPRGGLLHAPDTYMDKIAVGPGLPEGVIDLDLSAEENVRRLAEAKGVKTSELSACILDRPRHDHIVKQMRQLGVRINFITDNDVAGVISAADPNGYADIYMGRGGAPEGVLAAAALRCIGGQMQGRLHFRNDDERARAEKTGITDFDRKYDMRELASKDCVFVAAGVTTGLLVEGVKKIGPNTYETESLMLSSSDKVRRVVRTRVDGPSV
ncbi:class II fructose-bisphosphatase [Woodsholea maritima]|uniref:class II fructose-bisphosphatase n=1 Tax=Woodsholea maritima TaxID=240237 RepID=UPI0003804C5D|nr:class II fructose-bisphosphatase [Woodsholea maritima]